ncbi:MAG TPA: zf-HC2 domain-containing protein [Gemmatimonadaceae bacterium]|nr:zf-HC2 domain-containing protein [Gemmatimonadaceae bacterium]
MTCPAPEPLVAFALGDGSDGRVARHVATCERCQGDVTELREVAATLAASDSADAAPTAACLDELTIADVVDGVLPDARRHEVNTHLAHCARCRSAVRATAALARDPEVVGARPVPVRHDRRAWAVGAAAAAAAIVIAAVGVQMREGGRARDAVLREPAITSTVAPLALAPRGDVTSVPRILWSRAPGADEYRARIQTPDGSIVWEGRTADTSIAIPRTVRLVAGQSYVWRVEAETQWQRWVASDFTTFRIAPP